MTLKAGVFQIETKNNLVRTEATSATQMIGFNSIEHKTNTRSTGSIDLIEPNQTENEFHNVLTTPSRVDYIAVHEPMMALMRTHQSCVV